MQNANSAAVKRKVAEPVTLLKRIGSTTVEVTVHFSDKDNEALEDKLLRLMEREVRKSA